LMPVDKDNKLISFAGSIFQDIEMTHKINKLRTQLFRITL